MPTLKETASKLNSMLELGWNNLTPIAIENIQYEEEEGVSYISTQFIPYGTENVNISASTQKRKRTTGSLFIIIRTPIGKGIGEAYDYASIIQDIMDNKNPLSNLFTYVTKIARIGDDDNGWFNLTASVPFISDEI